MTILAPVFFFYYIQGPLYSILQATGDAKAGMMNSVYGGIAKLGCHVCARFPTRHYRKLALFSPLVLVYSLRHFFILQHFVKTNRLLLVSRCLHSLCLIYHDSNYATDFHPHWKIWTYYGLSHNSLIFTGHSYVNGTSKNK